MRHILKTLDVLKKLLTQLAIMIANYFVHGCKNQIKRNTVYSCIELQGVFTPNWHVANE